MTKLCQGDKQARLDWDRRDNKEVSASRPAVLGPFIRRSVMHPPPPSLLCPEETTWPSRKGREAIFQPSSVYSSRHSSSHFSSPLFSWPHSHLSIFIPDVVYQQSNLHMSSIKNLSTQISAVVQMVWHLRHHHWRRHYWSGGYAPWKPRRFLIRVKSSAWWHLHRRFNDDPSLPDDIWRKVCQEVQNQANESTRSGGKLFSTHSDHPSRHFLLHSALLQHPSWGADGGCTGWLCPTWKQPVATGLLRWHLPCPLLYAYSGHHHHLKALCRTQNCYGHCSLRLYLGHLLSTWLAELHVVANSWFLSHDCRSLHLQWHPNW